MADPRVQLRDPWLALILAFVLPGLGHLYQRRYLKSGIFFLCIMGLFSWGMGTAEGKAVYYRPPKGPLAGNKKEFIGYLAQAGVGLPAFPAIWQHSRFHSSDNRSELSSIDASFTGTVNFDDSESGTNVDEPVSGQLVLAPEAGFDGPELAGTFVGKTEGGRELTLTVGRRVDVDKPVDADPDRGVRASILNDEGNDVGNLVGSIKRPFWNYFEVPLDEIREREINATLGTKFELAYVLAMIAGMLNLLVAYDAFDGPAYGYDFSKDDEKAAK